MLSLLVKLLFSLVIIYIAIIAALSFVATQRCFMFLHWVKIPIRPKFDMLEFYGFPHNIGRNVKFQTSDKVTIAAWHLLPRNFYDERQKELRSADNYNKYDLEKLFDKAFADEKYDTIIYFHGNALHRAAPWRVDFYKRLSAKFPNSNIIALEYRGFGDSESTPTEAGLHLDARGVIDWLNNRHVSNNRISLIGHSLGTGVATALASDLSLAGNPPKNLILQAGYTSMATLIFEYNVIPFLPAVLAPIKLIPKLQVWSLSKLIDRFDSLSKIENVKCPILIIYGANDFQIPVTNSHKLFERAILPFGQIPTTNATITDALLDKGLVSRTHVPNEATVYKTIKREMPVTMVELIHGDHNNVGYFDYTYQSIHDMLTGTGF